MTVSNTVRKAVNVHGELHLDKERADSLISMIESFEEYEERTMGAMRSLTEAVKAGAMLAEHVAHGMISNGDEA